MSLKLKKGVNKQSAYNLRDPNLDYEAAHTLSIIVDNESGVLARVIGLFSGRGYNIDSLTVAEVDPNGHKSRITIVTTGTPKVVNQIKAQLNRMVPVHEVIDLTLKGKAVQRELAIFKVVGKWQSASGVFEARGRFQGKSCGQHSEKLYVRTYGNFREDRCIC